MQRITWQEKRAIIDADNMMRLIVNFERQDETYRKTYRATIADILFSEYPKAANKYMDFLEQLEKEIDED